MLAQGSLDAELVEGREWVVPSSNSIIGVLAQSMN